MLKKLLPILFLSLLLFHPTHSQAQTDDPAELLIIASQGDFWSWSEVSGLTRLTDGGNYYDYDRSPDGRYLVYSAYADFAAEAIAAGHYYPTEVYPVDLWQYDLQTGEVTKIASQPADAVYNQDEVRGYDRFNPQWSPDGSKIAWIQLPLGMEGGWQLVIYDAAAGVAEVVADHLPGPYGDAGMVGSIGLAWGSVGLITETFGGTDDNFFGQAFRVYDEAGALLTQHYMTSEEQLYPWFWSDDEAAIVGSVSDFEAGTFSVMRLDPFDHTEEIRPDQWIVTTSQRAPDQLAYHVEFSGEAQPLHWWLPDTSRVNEITDSRYLINRVALHPDGQRIAYVTDALYIWEDGATQRIPGTEQFSATELYSSLIWGEPTYGVMNRADVLLGAE